MFQSQRALRILNLVEDVSKFTLFRVEEKVKTQRIFTLSANLDQVWSREPDIDGLIPFTDLPIFSSNSGIDQLMNSAPICANIRVAILIYAFKFVLLKKTAGTLSIGVETVDKDDLSQLERLQRYHGMMKAFQHLGSVTESGFLKVWEALDPIVDEMKDFTVEDQELGRLSQWFSQIRYTEDR